MSPQTLAGLIKPATLPNLLIWATALLFSDGVDAQEVVRPDLAGIASETGWILYNRGAETRTEGGETLVWFDARPGSGVAWLEDFDFDEGEIEVRIRGKNVPQRSFVGVAFRGVDDQTYDAVYFRPFNFLADNPVSRSHSVQYVSHPDFTWSRLREEHPEEYENSLADPPDPDGFFKARIVMKSREVRVFLNDEEEPCLVVPEVSTREGGRIGLWMGNNSDGAFADLVVRPALSRRAR